MEGGFFGLATGQVFVGSHVVGVCFTEEPTVEHLVEVVEVVLSLTVSLRFSCGSLLNGQTEGPTIVHANCLKYTSTALVQTGLKILCARVDIEPGIFAISIGSTTALVLRNLHETLLSIASGDVGIAGGFLHGKRHEDRGRNAVGFFRGLKRPKDMFAGSKDRRIGSLNGRDDLELGERQLGRIPSARVETTVEEVLRSVGLLIVGTAGTAVAAVEAK